MPFPVQDRLPKAVAEYAHVANDKTADNVVVMVNAASSSLKLNEGTSARAASMVYLGLCVLRDFSSNGSMEKGKEACDKILKEFNPTSSGGVSVNCSFFKEHDREAKTITDHLKAVTDACDVYLPRVKSRKKRCFTLMMLGAKNASNIDLPETDDWLKTFNFHGQV